MHPNALTAGDRTDAKPQMEAVLDANWKPKEKNKSGRKIIDELHDLLHRNGRRKEGAPMAPVGGEGQAVVHDDEDKDAVYTASCFKRKRDNGAEKKR